MKFLYCSSIQYPSCYANRLQTIAMAKEFAKKLGSNFFLGGSSISVEDAEGLQVVNFKGSTKSFLLAFNYLSFIKKNKITHIFCREERLLFFVILYNYLLFRLPLVYIYECHFLPETLGVVFRSVFRKSDHVITLTMETKNRLLTYGVNSEKIFVAPDGVDIKKFDIPISQIEARKKLKLSENKKIILYTGHLYKWKGVDTLAEASKRLKDGTTVIFVGGTDEDIQKFKEKYHTYKNITIIGHRPHDEIPIWLKAADLVVLPNTANEDISAFYTSPLKLFEYMASGVPIIASRLPSLQEVLSDSNAFFFSPDDTESLVDSIEGVFKNPDSAMIKAKQAFKNVKNYDWKKRVQNIYNNLPKEG